jgi:cell division protein FtsL
MARIKTKRTHRRIRLSAFATVLFSVSLVLFLLSSVILRAYNVQLNIQVQKIRQEITILERNNHILNVELQALRSKDRVMAIANEAGLSSNQENIVIINPGD